MDALLQPGPTAIAPVADDDGRTVATVVARADRMLVVADGLAVNDTSSETYVVWGMREDVPEPIGTFDVVNDRMDLRPVGSDGTGLDQYSEYAISIEPGRQAPSVPTDVVAAGGDQLSTQETDAPVHRSAKRRRPPASGGHATTPTRRTACASGSPRPGGGSASAAPVVRPRLPRVRGRRRRTDRRRRPGDHPAARPGWLTVIAGLFVLATEFPLGRAAAGVHQEACQALDGLGSAPARCGSGADRGDGGLRLRGRRGHPAHVRRAGLGAGVGPALALSVWHNRTRRVPRRLAQW